MSQEAWKAAQNDTSLHYDDYFRQHEAASDKKADPVTKLQEAKRARISKPLDDFHEKTDLLNILERFKRLEGSYLASHLLENTDNPEVKEPEVLTKLYADYLARLAEDAKEKGKEMKEPEAEPVRTTPTNEADCLTLQQ